MVTRLTFLCASTTASSRTGAFPSIDEPLDDGGARKTAAFRLHGRRPDLVVSSPSRAAIETAKMIGLDALIEPRMADLHFGNWAGRTFADIERDDAPALLAWFADPTRATPGGEAVAEILSRVGAWLDRHAGDNRNLLVVSHAAVMRAAIAYSLSLPPASIIRVDIAPLSILELSFNGQWRLQGLRRPD